MTITHSSGDGTSPAGLIAQRYFELAAAGDADGVADLFAAEAIFIPSPREGRTIRGADEIRSYMRTSIPRASAKFKRLTFHSTANVCVVEIEADMATRQELMEVAEIFTLNQSGQIEKLSVYKR